MVVDWQNAPVQNFVAKPSLVMGPAPEAAVMTLVEFADFRCGHCKRASYTLHAFVKSHPDVRFEFYSFPLDGACNEKIEQANGISCRLATAVYCAEKEGKGWPLHETLYNIQEQVNSFATPAELDPLLSQTVTGLGLNWEHLQTCMNDPMSQDAIRSQAKQGGLVNVQGTPTIFANGKLLNRGNMVPVLQAVHEKILAGK
jgi:protein-disulfide isomerase